MAEIRLQNVSHRYPNSSESALRIGDFCWRDGGAYALLGPSGCGKSTLLNIISGLLAPTNGKILFGEQDVTEQDPRARNIAQVFQFPVIYDTMTVFNNLAFPLRNRGLDKGVIKQRVNEIAQLLELQNILPKKASGLSADQKQLISLGRGLVRSDVSAILFDEPLTVIDPHQKFTLRRILKQLHQEFKLILIYVTHDQSEALTFADQVAVMSQGEVMQFGTPEELYENPSHRFVGNFIGSPGMNFLPVAVSDNQLNLQGHIVPMETTWVNQAKSRQGDLALGIRPEYLSLSNHDNNELNLAALPVQIETVENYGNGYLINTRLNDMAVRVKVDEVPTQQQLYLHLPRAKTKLYVDDQLLEV